MVKKMWGEFERAGVELSAAHYGTLLTVLADNGHGHFSPKVNSVRSFVLNLDTKLLFDVNFRGATSVHLTSRNLEMPRKSWVF